MLLRATLFAIATGLAVAPALHAAPGAPPVEAFFENPAFTGALLSPSGKYLAAKIAKKGGRSMLAVLDLSTRKGVPVAYFEDTDINHVQWVNDQRLLFDTADLSAAAGQIEYGPGLYAVNRDGSKFRQLALRTGTPFLSRADADKLLPWHTFMLRQDGAQDSDSVYVQDYQMGGPGDLRRINLLQLNTLTGRTQTVSGPGDAKGWLLDQAGQPRLAITHAEATVGLHLREGESWRKLASFNNHKGGAQAMQVLAFGDGSILYVAATRGRDLSAVYRYDSASGKLDDAPVVELQGYDFHGSLVIRGGKLLGVHYLRDGEGTVWLDPAMQALQADIDQRLPGLVNMIELPRDPQAENVLVRAFSDSQPAIYLVYNRSSKTLERVGETRPGIDPAAMGVQEQVKYAARDGLQVPAMLTVPRAAKGKRLPMVVMVHGGPYLRGSTWGWEPQVQFLASRGYVVLAPEFRGSTGFGGKHFRSGWKQWGLKMQDDIADAVQWAVAQGYADPQRVCIMGASYGGYATLMGLVNDPQLYQCGVNYLGVTDIQLLYRGHWWYTSDISEEAKRFSMPDMVGDPVKDAEQFKATSPIEQAHRITRPVLLAYGGQDKRVPLVHGTRFRDAVRKTNQQVEWVEYPEEGHGWQNPKNRIDFWKRVEKFLDQHIGAGGKKE
ncbi:alpha/beta hydrolase family protein [Pseudoduganella sp.]|uniref:alpha/beta hydrolase family protein n=1 Tax=Pseudoduganella sp. TaxID=1880898 RepID=UPI0035B2B8BD